MLFAVYSYYNDEVKEDEMYGECRTHGRKRMKKKKFNHRR
jgi:hypothetical protein